MPFMKWLFEAAEWVETTNIFCEWAVADSGQKGRNTIVSLLCQTRLAEGRRGLWHGFFRGLAPMIATTQNIVSHGTLLHFAQKLQYYHPVK